MESIETSDKKSNANGAHLIIYATMFTSEGGLDVKGQLDKFFAKRD